MSLSQGRAVEAFLAVSVEATSQLIDLRFGESSDLCGGHVNERYYCIKKERTGMEKWQVIVISFIISDAG